MKNTSLALGLLLLLAGNNVKAQINPSWNTIFNNINTEVSTNSNAYNSLKISSETIGHRLTGSSNGNKAEQYAFDLLKSYGFTNLRFQPFEVESWSRGKIHVTIGADLQHQKDIKSVT